MTGQQKLIAFGTLAAVILLLAFRRGKTYVVPGGLNIEGTGGYIPGKDDGFIIDVSPGFDWLGGSSCACNSLEPVTFDFKPFEFGAPPVLAFQKPDLPPMLSLNSLSTAPGGGTLTLPPAPVVSREASQVIYSFRMVQVPSGTQLITKSGVKDVPGRPVVGALAVALNDGRLLATGLNNRPYAQVNPSDANSAILFGGRTWTRSDPV
jgi:hypothetical protein